MVMQNKPERSPEFRAWLDRFDAAIEKRSNEMVEWFFQHFEDPVENCPFESAEGGYQYIWGGPYDAREQLREQFDYEIMEEALERAVKEIEDRGGPCWSGIPKEER